MSQTTECFCWRHPALESVQEGSSLVVRQAVVEGANLLICGVGVIPRDEDQGRPGPDAGATPISCQPGKGSPNAAWREARCLVALRDLQPGEAVWWEGACPDALAHGPCRLLVEPGSQIVKPSGARRLLDLVVGHAVNAVMVYAFDYLLYPFVIWRLGFVRGGCLMALLSAILCLATLLFYNRSAKDWLGIEALKTLREEDSPSRLRRRLASLLRRSDWLACLLLSLQFDPFITTAYMRRGQNYGMTRRDWGVFALSWGIGNLAWALACFGGLELVTRLISAGARP